MSNSPDAVMELLLNGLADDTCDTDSLAELDAFAESFHLLALSLEPMPPSPSARDRLLSALKPTARFTPYINRMMELLDLTRDTVVALLSSLDDPSTEWEPGPCDGSSLIHLPAGPRFQGAVAGFLRVDAGVCFPHHKHEGREHVFVLQGAFCDADGTILRPGDERVMGDSTEHHFTVLSGPPLIYVVTLEAGVEFIDNHT